jgi:hypothetical protein
MGYFRSTRRQDLIFGSMLYMDNYWEGTAAFPFDPSALDEAVRGSKDGDMAMQHQFS